MKNTLLKKTTASLSIAVSVLSGSIATLMAAEAPKPAAVPAPAPNPLSLAGGVLTFDFQERIRWEARENNFDFNARTSAANKTDDDWFLNRIRLGLTIKPNSWLKLYVQAQDSREFNSDRVGLKWPAALSGAGADGDNAFDLRQAYAEIANLKECPWGLKIGRQTLVYGDERLVGASEWTNTARTFDALKVTYKGSGFSVDAFTSSVVVNHPAQFDQSDWFNGDELNRLQMFSGVYFTVDPFPKGTLDLYVFQVDSGAGALAAPTGTSGAGALARSTDFTTFGTRIKGDPKKLNGWEYSGEFAIQTGSVGGLDLNAYMASVGAGYNFKAPLKPRLYVEANYASGDKNAADGSLGTFQNLYPTNHKFYGMMDVESLQNLENILVSFKVSPTKTVTAQVDYNAFWAASTADAMYRANGTTKVFTKSTSSNYEGSEIDAIVTWNAKKYLQIQGGYSYFIPGNSMKGGTYVPATPGAGHGDARFAYLQAMVTF